MVFKYISSTRTLSSSKSLPESQKRRRIALAEVGEREGVGEMGSKTSPLDSHSLRYPSEKP